MLSKVQYQQLLKWEKSSSSLNAVDFTPEDESLYNSGHIEPSGHETRDLGDIVLTNHPTGFQISTIGRQALEEYRSFQRKKFNSGFVGFLLGILASVIATLVLKLFGI